MAPLVCMSWPVSTRSTSRGRWRIWRKARLVDQIKVAQRDAALARVALERMLAVS